MEEDSESESEPEGEPAYSDEEEELQATRLSKENGPPRAANGKVKTTRGRNERVMAPEECRAHLRLLFRNCPTICSLIFGRHGPFAPLNAAGLSLASADMFFIEVIPVPPTRFRPPAIMGETLFEHPQNELLAKVLNTSYRLRDLNADLHAASVKQSGVDDTTRRRLFSALLEALVQLQTDVNSFMDSNKNPTPVRNGKLPPAGVKQGLEKKEGLFRKHMMVRINFLLSASY
jgi:DNA-directed RNA polymerase I subunit RPA1